MSCSKPVPPFIFDLLYYLNRDQLERFSIICRPLKNFIERYFHSKPYRIFDELHIHGGDWYALCHNGTKWHPNRVDYSVQMFLAGQEIDKNELEKIQDQELVYTFSDMLPYLVQTIRIKVATIYVAGEFTYSHKQIEEMESIAYLWRDGNIDIYIAQEDGIIGAEDLEPILNSPIILKCQKLLIFKLDGGHFPFKDFQVLYTVKIIHIFYHEDNMDLNYWQQFLEQPGVKPVVVLHNIAHEDIHSVIDGFKKAFSTAVVPNAFKIVFAECDEPLNELGSKTNMTSGEKLELKNGLPVECEEKYSDQDYCYTFERSRI